VRTRKVLLVALPAKPHATLIAPGKKPLSELEEIRLG